MGSARMFSLGPAVAVDAPGCYGKSSYRQNAFLSPAAFGF